MPDVLTTAIIHMGKSLPCRLAERWSSKHRQADGSGCTQAIGPKEPAKIRSERLRVGQGMKSGLDFSIGEIRHSPRLD